MKTIYIVTHGEYSAYSIDAVFSTRELAQRFIDSLGNPQGYDEKMSIEEWELDENETHLREGYSPYYVEMYRDGTVKTVRISYRGWKAEFGRRINDERDDGQLTGKTILDITCKAKDETHAVKIANENRSQLIASGEWKPDERQVTT